VAENLKNAIILNVVLAIFNMFPLPPLDGGRIVVGLLPNFLALPFSQLEPYGMAILIDLIIILPLRGSQTGVDLSFVSRLILSCTETVITLMRKFTGNCNRRSIAGVS
jgi:Zn-dependent protease